VGSVVVGVPVGIGLAAVSVRVLGLFFTLPPPLLTLPLGALARLTGGTLLGSALALAVALRQVVCIDPAPLLREP
jgi:putative ABC transport system permease protein